jgi:hypothetical protein
MWKWLVPHLVSLEQPEASNKFILDFVQALPR